MGLPGRRLFPAAKLGLTAGVCALVVTTGEAAAGFRGNPETTRAKATAGWVTDGLTTGADGALMRPSGGASRGAAQHGPVSQHLPAARENVELISKLELVTPPQ